MEHGAWRKVESWVYDVMPDEMPDVPRGGEDGEDVGCSNAAHAKPYLGQVVGRLVGFSPFLFLFCFLFFVCVLLFCGVID